MPGLKHVITDSHEERSPREVKLKMPPRVIKVTVPVDGRRYTGARLRALRAERGVGVRK